MLETKQGADAKRTEGGRKLRQGHGKRGTRAWEATMQAARNQAEGYARNLEAAEPPPPFIVVCDVGFCLDLYADFSGSGRLYRPFPDAERNRLRLGDLRDPETRATLAAVFEDPLSLDPARRQARVTVELADELARLATSLDGAVDAHGAPMDAEAVASFLSRCLFSMFAEDAGLIPDGAFRRLLEAYADDLDHLPHALSNFFRTMDEGGYVGEVREHVRRFNGLLFKDTRTPRLSDRTSGRRSSTPPGRTGPRSSRRSSGRSWSGRSTPRSGTRSGPTSRRGPTSSGSSGRPCWSRSGRSGTGRGRRRRGSIEQAEERDGGRRGRGGGTRRGPCWRGSSRGSRRSACSTRRAGRATSSTSRSPG